MKQKIVELFQDASTQYGKTYEERCIYDTDFEQVAEAIVKLFSIPAVINNEVAVCDNPHCEDGIVSELYGEKTYCDNPIRRQTDL